MNKLNMAPETPKPQTAPAPADPVKHGEVKSPLAPSSTPAAAPPERK